MLFAKYRSESVGGRRHRPTSSEGASLPHALSMSQAGSSVLGPFPNSPPYPSPHAQPAAPPQRYPVSVPRHQVSVSPTMSRAVPGGGPPPPLSYHPDARGPPGSMVLTFEQGKLSFPVSDRVTFFFLLLPLYFSPHTLSIFPSASSPTGVDSRDRFGRFRSASNEWVATSTSLYLPTLLALHTWRLRCRTEPC